MSMSMTMLLRALSRTSKPKPNSTAFPSFSTLITSPHPKLKPLFPETFIETTPPDQIPSTIIKPSIIPPSGTRITHSRFLSLSPLNHSPTPRPWIAKISDVSDNKWRLVNPTSPANYFYQMDHPVIGHLNLSDITVHELYRLVSLVDSKHGCVISKKVVGEAGPLLALFNNEARGGGARPGQLLYWNPEAKKWAHINETDRFLDVAYYKGKFFAYDAHNSRVHVFGSVCGGTGVVEFVEGPTIDEWYMLVEEADFVPTEYALHLVVTALGLESKATMMVYVWNEEARVWDRVRSIGDQLFLIGDGVACSLISPSLPRGVICVFKDNNRHHVRNYSSAEGRRALPEGAECLEFVGVEVVSEKMRVFDMEEAEKGIVLLEDMPKEKKEAYAALFFPPPPWITWRVPSLGDKEVKLHNFNYYDPA